MTDTLQSIAREIEHSSTCLTHPVDFEQAAQGENCPKCRLEALLAEYEKVDLVRKWHELGDGLQCDHDDTCCHGVCADELETWLAVNLERIKAEARLEGEISEHKMKDGLCVSGDCLGKPQAVCYEPKWIGKFIAIVPCPKEQPKR